MTYTSNHDLIQSFLLGKTHITVLFLSQLVLSQLESLRPTDKQLSHRQLGYTDQFHNR